MHQTKQTNSNRRASATTQILIVLGVLAIIGVTTWRLTRRAHRADGPPKVVLEGATVTMDIGKGVKLELVRIEPGTFMMGSPETNSDSDPSEQPAHQVKISKPFYMGKFEITQQQWGVIRGNQSHSNTGEQYPADSISWNDAVNWCKEISEKTGVKMHLPTEAQWEYACRSGAKTRYYFGDQIKPESANYSGTDKSKNIGKTSLVGKYPPNAWGLYDMHGNVWEWCEDTLHENFEKAPEDGSAWMDPASKFNRVRKGGSWHEDAASLRSAVRWGSPGDEKEPDMRNNVSGFRVIVEVP